MLILIDDGSTDGTEELVRSFSFKKEIIKGDGTLWWAGGLQKGLKHLKKVKPQKDDIILIINNDTILKEDFLEKALNEISSYHFPHILCVPVFFTDSKRKENNCYVTDWAHFTFRDYGNKPERIDCASTRCLFIKYEYLYKIGNFRPRLLPHYFSDFEFTIRARKKGIKIIPAKSLSCNATEYTTGAHDIKKGKATEVLKQMFSNRFSLNPLRTFIFIALAVPLRWKFICFAWAFYSSLKFFFHSTVISRLRKQRITIFHKN